MHGDAALAGQARRDLVAEYGSARIDSRRGVGGHGGGAACARRLFDAEQSLLLVRLAASASRGDLPLLRHVADGFLAKYGSDWAFEVAEDGTFASHGGSSVYQLVPVQALGFGKGPFSHTRWDFDG